MFKKDGKKDRKNIAVVSTLSNSKSAGIAFIDPGPIKEQLKKIDSLIDKKRESLQRKEKDMASEDKTPVSSKFLIAFFAFLGGEIFKFLWKRFNRKNTVPDVASKNISFGHIVFYSLLSSLVSTLFSFFGYKIFGKKKKK